jgi:hypothetical protein
MKAQTSVGKVNQWLWGAVSENPEGLLLLAAGAVLLMRRSAGPKGSVVAGERDTLEHPSENERENGLSHVLESAASAASTASRYSQDALRKTRGTADPFVAQTEATYIAGLNRVLKDQPLIVPLAGLAAGAAVAALLPKTDFEKQTLGPVGEQITEGASQVGRQVKETAFKAAGTLKDGVDEHGLDPEGLKNIATEVAGVIRGGMSGSIASEFASDTSEPANRTAEEG